MTQTTQDLFTYDTHMPAGFMESDYAANLQKLSKESALLQAAIAANKLPALALAKESADLQSISAVAQSWRQKFRDIVIFGIGGSNLGGKAICRLADAESPRLHFIDSIDPHSFSRLLSRLDKTATGVIAISKSGNTAETLCQLHAVFAWMGRERFENQILAITENSENSLRALCDALQIPVLDHDPGVGGRFSALSLVGLLPAMLAGLDAKKIRKGAAKTLDHALQSQDAPAICGAAFAATLNKHHKITQQIVMPYCDRLCDFTDWHRQLWAESLGKDGKGITPVAALGAVDQHSQLQLFRDGPRDKMFAFILPDSAGMGPAIEPFGRRDERLNYLYGKTMGDLLAAEARATVQTLKNKDLPLRVIRMQSLDEESVGALMMHFMLETIFTASLLGVNPYDQPAVEEGKILARTYLSKSAA